MVRNVMPSIEMALAWHMDCCLPPLDDVPAPGLLLLLFGYVFYAAIMVYVAS